MSTGQVVELRSYARALRLLKRAQDEFEYFDSVDPRLNDDEAEILLFGAAYLIQDLLELVELAPWSTSALRKRARHVSRQAGRVFARLKRGAA